MREKDKLNLETVDELVESSSLRRLFRLTAKGAQGAGSGLGFGGLVMTLLAVAGISVAFIYEIVAAATGAAVFGILAVAVAGYQLWKQQAKIKKLKTNFDSKLNTLRESVIKSLQNLESVDELIGVIKAEIARLSAISQTVDDQYESKRIQDQLEKSQSDLKELEKTRQNIIRHLQISLSVIVGDNYTDKLSHLFGTVHGEQGKGALHNYANLVLNLTDDEVAKVSTALDKVWHDIDQQPLKPGATTDRFKSELDELMKPEKAETHRHMKRFNYVLTGFGGFVGGVGLAITIASLIFGGIAALTVIGWPIAVAAVGVGAITMVGTVLYYRHVQKRQQKAVNKINLANAQVVGMTSYLDSNVNNEAKNQVTHIHSEYVEAGKETSIRLHQQKLNFGEAQEVGKENIKAIHSLQSEYNHFKPTEIALDSAAAIKELIKDNITVLKAIRKSTGKIAVIACSEDIKTQLLSDIDQQIEDTRAHLDEINALYATFNKVVHPINVKQLPLEEKAEANLKVVRPDSFPPVESAQKMIDELEDSEGEGEGPKIDLQKKG